MNSCPIIFFSSSSSQFLKIPVTIILPSIISPATFSDGSAYRQTPPPHPRHHPYRHTFLSRCSELFPGDGIGPKIAESIKQGCYFQEADGVKMNMSIETAYRKSIETILNWISKEVDTDKTQVIFRGYSPVHFRGGDWKSGGSCHLETLPDLSSSPVSPATMFYSNIIGSVLSKHKNRSSSQTKLKLLNVTYMSSKRKDGHASVYYSGPKDGGPAPLHRQGCSHWCLPGVPDSWNELLYKVFLKCEYSRSSLATTEHEGWQITTLLVSTTLESDWYFC